MLTKDEKGSGKSTLSKAIVPMIPSFERVSIDGIIASAHGICGVDYESTMYATYQDEADRVFAIKVEEMLMAKENVVLDRSFYAKENRDAFQRILENCGARCILVYFAAPKEVLWERIQTRWLAGVNADSALEISRDTFDMFFDNYEVPVGEGEIVAKYDT